MKQDDPLYKIAVELKEKATQDCDRMADTLDGEVIRTTIEELCSSKATLLKFQQQCLSLATQLELGHFDSGDHSKRIRQAYFLCSFMASGIVEAHKIRERILNENIPH